MLELNPDERRALRAKAHHLHPVVAIGQHGLTPTVLTEIDLALNAHGLIKVRVFNDDRAAREALLDEICEAMGCAPVQHLGKLLVLWRPQPEPADAPPAKTAKKKPSKKGGQKPVAVRRRPITLSEAKAMTRGTPAERPKVARRARGQPATAAAKNSGTTTPARTPRTSSRAADPTVPGSRRRRRTTS